MSTNNQTIGIERHDVSGDVAVGRNVVIGGNVKTKGSHLVLGDVTVEGWLNAANINILTDDETYSIDIKTDGDNFLAFGERIHIFCTVLKNRHIDMTSSVKRWTITRDTGRENEDNVWNLSEKARYFNGEIDIELSNFHNDLGDTDKATFTITAYFNDVQVNRLLEI